MPRKSDSRTTGGFLLPLMLSNECSVEWHGISHQIERTPAHSANQVRGLATQLERLVVLVDPRRHDATFAKIGAGVVDPDPVDRILDGPRLAKGRPGAKGAIAGKGGRLENAVDAVFRGQSARQVGIPHVGAN